MQIDRYVEKLIAIKNISFDLQKIHAHGVRAALDLGIRVQEGGYKETIWISLLIIFVVALASVLAVTYLHRGTVDFMKKQEIETIGLLARNFAHEIRNPLGIIKSSADLIKERISPEAEESELAGYLVDEVSRIDDLLYQFLSLGDTRKVEKKEEDIGAILNQCLALIEGERKKNNIVIENNQLTDELILNCNRNQIKQVIINLILNAIHASRKNDKIILTTQKVNKNIIFKIQDFGKGIESKFLNKIFDPFYTTKDGGFGIGLSVVKKIVAEHGGVIHVHSNPNMGTTFELVFKNE